MRLLAISIVTLFIFSACEQKIEDPLKSLQEEGIHRLNLNLYPSNLKMINTNNNPDFAEATKGIKKLHVLQINLDDDSTKAAFDKWESAQDFTEWESIFSARMQNGDIEIKAPEGRDDILFASAETKEGLFVGFLEGTVDMSQIPALMKADLDLGPIGDFLQDKEKKKEQRQKRKRLREGMEQDSTSTNPKSTKE